MLSSFAFSMFILGLVLSAVVEPASPKSAAFQSFQTTMDGTALFGLGNITYLAHVQHPKATLTVDSSSAASQSDASMIPCTVMTANDTIISSTYLESTISAYLAADDVFSDEFLRAIYITSAANSSPMI